MSELDEAIRGFARAVKRVFLDLSVADNDELMAELRKRGYTDVTIGMDFGNGAESRSIIGLVDKPLTPKLYEPTAAEIEDEIDRRMRWYSIAELEKNGGREGLREGAIEFLRYSRA